MAVRTGLMDDKGIGERKLAAGSRDGVEPKSRWTMTAVPWPEDRWEVHSPAQYTCKWVQSYCKGIDAFYLCLLSAQMQEPEDICWHDSSQAQ